MFGCDCLIRLQRGELRQSTELLLAEVDTNGCGIFDDQPQRGFNHGVAIIFHFEVPGVYGLD